MQHHATWMKRALAAFVIVTLLAEMLMALWLWQRYQNLDQQQTETSTTTSVRQDIENNGESTEDSTDAERPVSSEEQLQELMTQYQFPHSEIPASSTYLHESLEAWQEKNPDTCVYLSMYKQDERRRTPYYSMTSDALSDVGVRAALLSYFDVSVDQRDVFFEGIDAAMDTDDLMIRMCSGSADRRFLTLEEVRSGNEQYAKVMEWVQATTGGQWVTYPVVPKELVDGYDLVTDWKGNVIVKLMYGDAGYLEWDFYLLSRSGMQTAYESLESCVFAPDYADTPGLTCALLYTP